MPEMAGGPGQPVRLIVIRVSSEAVGVRRGEPGPRGG